MIPIPKPKFVVRKFPPGQARDDYFDEICRRQTHSLCDAIDRVSTFLKNSNESLLMILYGIKFILLKTLCFSSFILRQWTRLVF